MRFRVPRVLNSVFWSLYCSLAFLINSIFSLSSVLSRFLRTWQNSSPGQDGRQGEDLIIQEVQGTVQTPKDGVQTLGTLNLMDNAYANRVIYDRKGEELCSKFTTVFEEQYPDITFAQQATDIKLKAERVKIFSKGQATRIK